MRLNIPKTVYGNIIIQRGEPCGGKKNFRSTAKNFFIFPLSNDLEFQAQEHASGCAPFGRPLRPLAYSLSYPLIEKLLFFLRFNYSEHQR